MPENRFWFSANPNYLRNPLLVKQTKEETRKIRLLSYFSYYFFFAFPEKSTNGSHFTGFKLFRLDSAVDRASQLRVTRGETSTPRLP
uniref:Uncharacterized protein n=1 Tax=Brassica oleracea TaxID=3712 RepID=A0A3P6CLG6_BRAOL|nr:unnamed protein product [Brassica oleracea]